MRLAAIILLVLVLSAEWRAVLLSRPAAHSRSRAAAERCRSPARASRRPAGKGSLEIVDLNPNDQWSPRVNGIPRGKTVTLRGKNVSFYIPGGRYKVTARGSDISISARGTGA